MKRGARNDGTSPCPGISQAPVRPDLIEGYPLGLLCLVSEGARFGVENGQGLLDETSPGGGAVSCPLGSAPL